MRIGIDFDNTIICYDSIFLNLAKSWQLVPVDYQGSKRELRDLIRKMPEGDLVWQKMQGQAYGALIHQGEMFPGFKPFIEHCNQAAITVFIVSHKTEHGHFDKKKISLRDAARNWLRDQGLFTAKAPFIPQENVFFETTREEKIERIKELCCTHFIDDLIEVLESPLFPGNVNRYLFHPQTSWAEIKHAIFRN